MMLLIGLALAAPTRVAAVLEAGTGASEFVVDGTRVGLLISGHVVVFDLDTWESETLAVCSDNGGLAGIDGVFYAGCGDGSVSSVVAESDGGYTVTDAVYGFDGAVLGLHTDGTNLYAVTDADGSLAVEAVDLALGTTVSGYPSSLLYDGFEDLVPFGTSLLILQGSDDVARLELASGVSTLAVEQYGGSFVQGYADGTLGVLLADESGGGVARFDSYDNGFSPILTALGDEVTAVAVDSEALYAVADGALLSYGYTSGGFAGDAIDVLDDVGVLVDLLPTDGYLFGADGANVLVMTDRPWVEIVAQSSDVAVSGSTMDLTFVSDEAGAWNATLDGAILDSGEATAGAETVASFSVSDIFPEGQSRVRIALTAEGREGHDAIDLNVDNPPGAVTLGADGVGVGDGQISVSFEGIPDEDLTSYTVYLSDVPFTAAEYPTGGPVYAGEVAVGAPYTHDAAPGATFGVSFYPLTNGTPYYVAVRATAGGVEGPMSDVQSATPMATYSASQLAGDPGGCAVPGGRPTGLLGALLAGAVLLRRRAAPLAAGMALGLMAAGPARAQEEAAKPHMHVQLKGGPSTLADPHVRDIFGKVNKTFGVEYGATTRLVEVSLGIGFFQELGFLPTADGTPSVEHDMLTVVPLSLTGTLRLDFFDEQILVPMGRIGGDYTMWKENWYVYEGSTEESVRKGGKFGWHWGAGAMILLDPLDARAASRMEATAGIEDTFLVIEYRRTQLPKGDGVLLLSAEDVTFGVKFDF